MVVNLVQKLKQAIHTTAHMVHNHVSARTKPTHTSLMLGSLSDLIRTKPQLIAENALLRRQLIVLNRSVKRPHLTASDRSLMVLLASRVRAWKSALLIVQPDTLLRWHRQGSRLFWRRKSREATPFGTGPKYLIRDNDAKYGSHVDAVAAGSRIHMLRTPFRAPRANAICERLLGSVRRQCLDHMLLTSEAHLYHVLKEYVRYFNGSRPHQGINQRVPEGEERSGSSADSNGTVIALPILGGLHHEYRRVA